MPKDADNFHQSDPRHVHQMEERNGKWVCNGLNCHYVGPYPEDNDDE